MYKWNPELKPSNNESDKTLKLVTNNNTTFANVYKLMLFKKMTNAKKICEINIINKGRNKSLKLKIT
jgi:hypothetical protein